MSGSVFKPALAAGLVAVGVGGAWGWQPADSPKPADPPAATAKPESPAERWAKLKAEYDADVKANTRPVLDPDTGEPQIPRSFTVLLVPEVKYHKRLMELGRGDDSDTAAAALSLAAGEWIGSPTADLAFDLLLDRFGNSPLLGPYARQQVHSGNEYSFRRTQRILGVSRDPYVRAYSLLKLAFHHKYSATPGAQDRATELFKQVVAEYPAADNGHAARWAARVLREMEVLRAGLPAPPLDAPDVDGKPLALVDYRGQVVALYVGSVGNLNTVENLPWLKAVVEKYAGRGVTVVGLLSAFTVEDARREAALHVVPWRTWPDVRDPKTSESPLLTALGVHTHPSVVLIDRAGVIREPCLRSREELEAALDKLLAVQPAK